MSGSSDTVIVARDGYYEQRIPIGSYTLDMDTIRMVPTQLPVTLELTASVEQCQSIRLSFDIEGDGVASLILDRDDGRAGDFSQVATPDTGDSSYRDGTVLPYRSYQYRLYAIGEFGDTLAPQSAMARTGACGAWEDAVAYHIVIDRFSDGNAENNLTGTTDAEPAADYMGGDFKGILDLIEQNYFADLGVNTIFITFPGENANTSAMGPDGHVYAAFEGTWPTNPYAVESGLGSADDLRALIDSAHARGMRIVAEYQPRHLHMDSPVTDQEPPWFPGGCTCGEEGCDWNVYAYTCQFADYLSTFDFSNSAARAWSVDNAWFWMDSIGFDGLLLDDVRFFDPLWIEDMRAVVTAGDPENEKRLFGTAVTFERDEAGFFVDPATRLDGLVDENLRLNLVNTVLSLNGSMSDAAAFLTENDTAFGDGALMLNMLGSRSNVRSIHLAQSPPLFQALGDGSDQVWANQPTLPRELSAFQKVGLGFAVLYTSPGIPLIYYGDEIGLPGALFPDNARMMVFGELDVSQLWLKDRLSLLAEIRAEHSALRRGTRTTRATAADTWLYSMADETDTVWVAVNRSSTTETIAAGMPTGNFTNLVSGAPVSGSFSLSRYEAAIFVRN